MNDTTTTTAGTTAATTTTAAATAAGASGGAAPAWYEGKVEAETVGFWQRKGYDTSDPIKVVTELTKGYSGAEKLIGVRPEELLRMPRANAAETDVKAFWGRVGVPAEAKEYDFSGVKFADGKELDQEFSDTMRAALLDGRVPKDRASGIVSRLVKFMEAKDAADAAELTANVAREKEALNRNWGANKARNEVVANDALRRLADAAGVPADQATKAWDALSKVGGIGAASTMEMLRVIGERMLDPSFISGGRGTGDPALMSRESAQQEIDMLKKDAEFGKRLLAGDRESRRKWDNLHKVAAGVAA